MHSHPHLLTHLPALQLSEDKKVLTPFRGPLDVAHLKSFLTGLTSGRTDGAQPYPASIPSAASLVASAPEWDGKDAPVTSAEEFSLEDLEL